MVPCAALRPALLELNTARLHHTRFLLQPSPDYRQHYAATLQRVALARAAGNDIGPTTGQRGWGGLV